MLHINLEKAKPGRRRRRQGLLHRLHAKLYRLPAHVTSEDDWQRDVPNVKLSRAFAVVLSIHVVAIGGFMAFELFRHKPAEDPAVAAAAAAASSARPPTEISATTPPPLGRTSLPAAAPRAPEPALDDPANEGLRTYVVGPRESLAEIAAQFEVDEHLLAEKNGLGKDRPFESGMKLIIPNHQIMAHKPQDAERLLDERAPGLAPDNPMSIAPAEPVDTDPPAATAKATPQKGAAPGTSVATAKSTPPANAAARPPKSVAEKPKPIRRAEPVRDASPPVLRPNRDPKRASREPAKMAAAQSTRMSTASAGGSKTPAKTAKASADKKARKHVVGEGDTAYKIARQYRVDLDRLIKVNGIRPEKLRPGTQLVIPAAAQ